MKTILHQSKNAYLIWLFSFFLLFQANIGYSGNGSKAPLRNPKQTELTLTALDKKSVGKSTSYFTVSLTKHAPGFTGDLSFLTRIFQHTQITVMKWKMTQHLILSPSFNIVHIKIAQNDDEDLSLLKG